MTHKGKPGRKRGRRAARKREDISRAELEERLRALGWQPVEYDLLGGDYWHRPPHGLHVPLVNYPSNRDKLAAIERETERQDSGGEKPQPRRKQR